MVKISPAIMLQLLVASSIEVVFAGYGDCIDTLPSAVEREVHVMTNAVRMDPVGFRDKYITGTNILLPANYPAVAPLWYNHDLSRAARFHSVDMAKNCGMMHESSDGTKFNVRLNSFYKTSSSIGENVATGKTTGLQTVVQWLRDDQRQGTTQVPAKDKDSLNADGHRKNIMNSVYKEIGAGYSYNASRQLYHFWTQDFGGGSVSEYKIPAGCHFSATSNTISYSANYYDKSGIAPQSAMLVIDNTSYPMTLLLGTAAKGTYIYTSTKDQKEHIYHFLFTDGNGKTIRFPETVRLTTDTSLCITGEIAIKEPFHISNNRRLQSGQSDQNKKTYLLNGTKLTGKLSMYYAAGIAVKGSSMVKLTNSFK